MMQIHHTNTIMSIADKFVIICSASIEDPIEKSMVLHQLNRREIIDISLAKDDQITGNVYEVINEKNERCLIMSKKTREAFTAIQIDKINNHCKIIAIPLTYVEQISNGNIKSMITGIFN